jgi:hypothetical protein
VEHHHIEFVLHRWCMNYGPVIWLHVLANALLCLAYIVIPVIIIIFVRRHASKIPKHYIFYFAAAFIGMCGLTHGMAIWTMMYRPDYFAEGALKMAAAVVSIITAAALSPALKYYAGFKDLAEYRLVNHELRNKLTALQLQNEEQMHQMSELQRIGEHRDRVAHRERELLIQNGNEVIERSNKILSELSKITGSQFHEQ